MPRTDAESVARLLEDFDGDAESADEDLFEPFILSSNELVTELCTDSDYSDARLELIERWLAAHFWTISHQQVKFFSAQKVQESYDSKVDLYLNQTKYGQMAQMLDTKGNLAALNNVAKDIIKRVAGGTWLGKTSEEVEPWE